MPFWSTIPCTFSSLPTFTDPAYVLKAGDIVFHVTAGKNDAVKIGHTLLTAQKKTTLMVHSTAECGVFSSHLNEQRSFIIFRFTGDNSPSDKAARLAISWSRGHYLPSQHKDYAEFNEQTSPEVGYTSARWQLYRGYGAALGTSTFGSRARARLSKYRGRPDTAPRNVNCAELVILAYQLVVGMEEESYGFIKLDAKHTTPGTLAHYLYNNPFWQMVSGGTPDEGDTDDFDDSFDFSQMESGIAL